MGLSPSLTNTFIFLAVLVVVLPVQTYAFGAGDIPDFAYLNDKAFRHGDIENILEEVAKTAGHAALGGGSLLGIASSVFKHVSGGSKFSKSDIKKVYFGNWLRDYSQAMDIAGLSKLTADSLILVVSVLGFMTFGFATQEFEVTADRLGVYLPVEHIDNPKGYAEKEGDARKFHPKLRPPVNPEELEIDQQNGMKKYMATNNRGWDTSTAFISRTFRSCIEAGRRSGGNDGPDRYEAYRLLGTGLHTMEDLLAHSNWCEIALRKLGHNEVFCHVGDNVSINTPNGRAPPLVTGTFGSADFLHSLLGEAGDKISQASVTDLSQKINDAQGGKKADLGPLKAIFGKIGGGGGDKMNKADQMNQQAQAYNLNPDNVAPPEVQKQLLDILKWHDDVMRDIIKRIEMVPGLENLLEEFSNALNAYIYTLLAPYLGPLLQSATGALDEGSKMVIDSDDQYEVFNNPNAQDPSHSLLSKDHFGLILNEPAGKIAQIVVIHSTNLIVRAWSDNSNPDEVINQILEAFHHPYYATGRSDIQNKMFDQMQKWIGGMGSEATEIIASLTKDAVRDHRNKRKGLEDTEEPGYGGCGHGGSSSAGKTSGGYKNPSYGGEVASHGAGNGGRKSTSSQGQFGGNSTTRTGGSGGNTSGGRRNNDDSYGSSRRDDNSGYTPAYGGSTEYGGLKHGDSGRQSSGYGNQQRDDLSYGGGGRRDNDDSYSSRQDNTPHGGGRRHDDNRGSGYGGGHSGSHGRQDDDKPYSSTGYDQSQTPHNSGGYNASYGQTDNSGYGGNQHGRKKSDDGNRQHHGQSGAHGGGGRHEGYEQSTTSGYRTTSSSGYGQTTSSGFGQSGASGYAPSYGGNDDTFGAERLDLGRDDNGGHHKKKDHHEGGGYGESGSGGYGGGY